MSTSSRRQYLDPRYNYGVPGSIYVLQNSALRDNLFKLGATRSSGWAKVLEFNRDPDNSVPGKFECIFEITTNDCGRALERLLQELKDCRCGRNELAYFDISLAQLKELVQSVCRETDRKNVGKIQDIALATTAYHLDADQQIADMGGTGNAVEAIVSGSDIARWFRRKMVWAGAAISLSVLVVGALLLGQWLDQQNQSEQLSQAVAPISAPILPASKSGNVARVSLPSRGNALSESEKTVLGLSCIATENPKNPQAFHLCVQTQLQASTTDPIDKLTQDLSRHLNAQQKRTLEYECMKEHAKTGLDAYRTCLKQGLIKLDAHQQKLSLAEKSARLLSKS
ncbi:GIY-YIG nuclease family protein [Undibacterium sp. Jales W-56]|uniref:GIY-YIG nuclease family protein n=1 Tax=Undibacterium sp. Jales W-56 TaxID=2897325 RepID=UPI0021CF2FF7|nr:GIY-YIG nuclease family protein [Undibacterium sp. Jales W-56]MCU6433036.1 GIY-YIG nuclease family protein [Undibacterium sp. Jales W-56]